MGKTGFLTGIVESLRTNKREDVLDEARSLLKRMQEAYPWAQAEIAADDVGWMALGKAGSSPAAEWNNVMRRNVVEKARMFWAGDPLCKQAVRVWTDYSIGSGIDWKTKSERATALIGSAFKNKRNRGTIGPAGQRRMSNKLLIDGELFIAALGRPPELIFRLIDPLEITALISDPEDADTILAYRREWTDTAGKTNRAYYASADYAEEIPDQLVDPDYRTNVARFLQPDVSIIHVPFDSFFNRGLSLLAPVVSWADQHSRFMGDRVSIVRALAKYVCKVTAAGSPAGMAELQRTINALEPQAGSYWVSNQAVDMVPLPRDTGGSAAKIDGDMLKLMVCAGTGIMAHYLGDPSTGNLATATAMELPMLKQFGAYQKLWADTYHRIIAMIIGEDAYEQAGIDVDFPPILESDIAKISTAIGQLTGSLPGFAKLKDVQAKALMALGVNNISEVLDELEELNKEEELNMEEPASSMDYGQQPPELAKKRPIEHPMAPETRPDGGQAEQAKPTPAE